MKRITGISILLACLSVAGSLYAKDYSFPANSGVTATKTYDAAKLMAGKATAVSFLLKNASTLALNGLFYSEHLPSTIALSKGVALVNGKAAVGVGFETSAAGAVYSGLKTYTWVFEEPGSYGTQNQVAARSGKVEIRYTITYKGSVQANWEGHSWAGKLGAKSSAATHAVFGYCDRKAVSGTAIRPLIPTVPSVHGGISISPNPVGDLALIRFSSGAAADGRLLIVNASGREIRTIPLGSAQSALWDGRDASGVRVAPGIYWIRLNSGADSHTAKMQVYR